MKKKCKHQYAYDESQYWCIKCGHKEPKPLGTLPPHAKPFPELSFKDGEWGR